MSKDTTSDVLFEAIRLGRVGPSDSNEKIGTVIGYAKRTVAEHLRRLEEQGRIRIDRRPPNRYGPGTDPTGRTIVAL